MTMGLLSLMPMHVLRNLKRVRIPGLVVRAAVKNGSTTFLKRLGVSDGLTYFLFVLGS
jgi:hypothetical protein